MADVRSFRAVRYAQPSPAVTAPPYDVIDDAALEELRARDPHNVVHLTLEPDAAACRASGSGSGSTRASSSATTSRRSGRSSRTTSARTASSGAAAGSSRRSASSRTRREPCSRTSARTRGRRRAGFGSCEAARAQLEPIFLLYDGSPPSRRPTDAPDLEAAGTRLWRADDAGRRDGVFAGSQLLIADGHHRYETALRFAARGRRRPDARRARLDSPTRGSRSSPPTGSSPAATTSISPATPFPTVEDAFAALLDEPYTRSAAVLVRPDSTRLVHGAPGELDVELVDRLGHDGISYTPDRVEACGGSSRGSATARCSCGRRGSRTSSSAPPRRGDAAEDDVLLPQAPLGPALPSGRPVTDWLAFCRACVADLERRPRRAADARRARAGAARRRGRRRHDRHRRSGRGRRRPPARGARPGPDARLRGARRADLRGRRPAAGRRRPDRRLGQREARDPVLLALARRRRRPTMDDVSFGYVYDFGAGRGVGRGARSAARSSAARRSTVPARRTRSRSSRSRARRPRRRRRGAGAASASRTACA